MVEDLAGGEPTFVGEGRKKLVDDLVEKFRAVKGDEEHEHGPPHWVSFEAPPGWGKSRIAREFYRKLAEPVSKGGFQDDGVYWPRSILDAVHKADQPTLDIHGRRKRVYPEVIRPEQKTATPAWFWWGFNCYNYHGQPVQALQFAAKQFENAKPGIDERWKRARPTERVQRWLKEHWDDLAEAGAGAMVEKFAEMAASPIPFLDTILGLAVDAGRWTVQQASRKGVGEEVERITSDQGHDLVDKMVGELKEFAQVVMPIVVFVEDFHEADGSIVELLTRLLTDEDSRGVLVVTTAHPGKVDEERNPSHQLVLDVASDRCTRHATDDGVGGVRPELEKKPLTDLTHDEARQLVDHLLSRCPTDVATSLVQKYSDPLCLQLACGDAQLQVALEEGDDADALRIVETLPEGVADLYEKEWLQLSRSARLRCELAVVTTLAGTKLAGRHKADGWSYDEHIWDAELVDAAINADELLRRELQLRERSHGESPTDDSSGPHPAPGWVRIDPSQGWVGQFRERIHFTTAWRSARNRYDETGFDRFFAELVANANLDALDEARKLHRARLIVALEQEGHVERCDVWREADALVSEWRKGGEDSESTAKPIELAPQVRSELDEERRTDARGGLGEYERATREREQRAWLAAGPFDAGRTQQAIEDLEHLLEEQTRAVGALALDRLRTREDLGWCRRHRAGEIVADTGSYMSPVTSTIGLRGAGSGSEDVRRLLSLRLPWERCSEELLDELGSRLRERGLAESLRFRLGHHAPLPFGLGYELFDLAVDGISGPSRAFLVGASELAWLDGSSAHIHNLNDTESLQLTDDEVLDYVRWFLFAMRGDSGAFVLIDNPDLISDTGGGSKSLDEVRSALVPFTLQGLEPDGRFRVGASIAYEGSVASALFAVDRSGPVEMLGDEPIADLDGLGTPDYPPLIAPLMEDD